MTARMLGAAELAVLGAKPLAPEDPAQVGRYRLCGVLGVGGMGRVYLGWADSRYIAVKVIRPELADGPEFRTRFARELKSVSRVDAAFTAPLLDAQADATRPWMATEYVAGVPLSEATSPAEPLPPAAVWRLAAGVGMALSSIHQVGLVHRDLKPANVILALDGPKVIDFGVARSADMSQLTVTGQHVGTPSYMAPEQAKSGAVSPASDVFALGGLLAFAATGRTPFGESNSTDVMFRVVYEEPDIARIADLDPQLHALVAQCMAKDPAARPTAAGVVAATVAAKVGGDWPDQLHGQIAQRAQVAGQTMPEATIGPPGGPFTTGGDLTGLPVRPAKPTAKRRRRWPIFAGTGIIALACATGLLLALLPADKPKAVLSADKTPSVARTTSTQSAGRSAIPTPGPSKSTGPVDTSSAGTGPAGAGPSSTGGGAASGPTSTPGVSGPTSTQAAPTSSAPNPAPGPNPGVGCNSPQSTYRHTGYALGASAPWVCGEIYWYGRSVGMSATMQSQQPCSGNPPGAKTIYTGYDSAGTQQAVYATGYTCGTTSIGPKDQLPYNQRGGLTKVVIALHVNGELIGEQTCLYSTNICTNA